jgi:hypothetical protein
MSAPKLERDEIRPALRGSAREIAGWAMVQLARQFDLSDAECGVIVAAITTVGIVGTEELNDPPIPCPCDGPRCLVCGCCQHQGCEGGCIWVTPTLCSRCA